MPGRIRSSLASSSSSHGRQDSYVLAASSVSGSLPAVACPGNVSDDVQKHSLSRSDAGSDPSHGCLQAFVDAACREVAPEEFKESLKAAQAASSSRTALLGDVPIAVLRQHVMDVVNTYYPHAVFVLGALRLSMNYASPRHVLSRGLPHCIAIAEERRKVRARLRFAWLWR